MVPADPKLYAKAKEYVKKRVKVWPSAYASGMVVQRYKKLGGVYKGAKPKRAGIDRWFKERWVDICKPRGKGRYAPCGRQNSDVRKYPKCRPSIRVSKQTPMTISELVAKFGKAHIDVLCKDKRKYGLPKKGKPVRRKLVVP